MENHVLIECLLKDLEIGNIVCVDHAHVYSHGSYSNWVKVNYEFIGRENGNDGPYIFQHTEFSGEKFRMWTENEEAHKLIGVYKTSEQVEIKNKLSRCVDGTKIWFNEEKRPYKVMVSSERYLICTKPFNLKKTVYYTIVDLNDSKRGTDNRLFSKGYETREDCLDNMVDLLDGQIEISHRNRIDLKITKIE